jgi:hypothetical protein
MTQTQQIACGALAVECKLPGKDLQMAALVYLFGKIAGVTNCNDILAGAQTMTCLDRQQQLPALIWLALQILNAGGGMGPPGPPGPAGPVLSISGNYGGLQPPLPSLSPGQLAVAQDTSTGQLWYFPYGATQWQ